MCYAVRRNPNVLSGKLAIALEQALAKRSTVIQLPASCILYLRQNKHMPDYLELTLRTAEGASVPYRVRALKAQEETLEDIFRKKLLIYLPYYIMRYEARYSQIEADAEERDRFFEEVRELLRRLTDAVGQEDSGMYGDLRELIVRVSDHMLRNHEPLRKGVASIMGGQVLELLSERMLRIGREEGREQGRIALLASLVNDGILSPEAAAERLHMTEEAFRAGAEACGCPVLSP